jgi:aminoglycoside/choline kinase family phosphotransferase
MLGRHVMHPRSAGDIDDAWLGGVLGAAVAIESAEPVAAGVGLLGAVVAVRLRDGRRFYVKLPSPDARTRAITRRFGYDAREAGSYRDLLDGAGLPTPRCRAVLDGDDGPILVLDALEAHRPADQLAGATPAQAHAAAALAASVHARFWDSPALAACSWLPGPTDPVVAMYGELFALTWGPFCDLVDDLVPADHLHAAERAIDRFADVCAAFARAPRTLVHGDFRLDNLLFTEQGDAAVLDWQLAAWGRGPYDLAFFAAGSVEPEVLARIEDDLLVTYHAALVDHGVTGYSFDACRHDYLGGLVQNLPNPVTALVAVPPGNERGARLLRENARRSLATVARHGAELARWTARR